MVRVNQRTAAFAVDLMSLRSTFSVRAVGGGGGWEAEGVVGAGIVKVDF